MPYELNPDKIVEVTRVYYEDKMYETLNWDTLPNDGVVIVVVIRKDGSRRTMHQYDWYFQARGLHDEIFGGTNDRHEIRRYGDDVTVLRAKWVPDISFEAIRMEANK